MARIISITNDLTETATIVIPESGMPLSKQEAFDRALELRKAGQGFTEVVDDTQGYREDAYLADEENDIAELSNEELQQLVVDSFASNSRDSDGMKCTRIFEDGTDGKTFIDSLVNKCGPSANFSASICAFDLTGSHLGRRLDIDLGRLRITENGEYIFTAIDQIKGAEYQYRATFIKETRVMPTVYIANKE